MRNTQRTLSNFPVGLDLLANLQGEGLISLAMFTLGLHVVDDDVLCHRCYVCCLVL